MKNAGFIPAAHPGAAGDDLSGTPYPTIPPGKTPTAALGRGLQDGRDDP